ncbi:hypothetical protein KGM48_02160 [Patescibacteria group bacterium]|nr:hypothetical protein [Patescibacteria group bacterium]
MEKPKTTAKDFFFWAGAIVALYWTVIAYVALIFDYINYTFQNPLSYLPIDPYQSGISYEMASVIVLLPIYVLLRRLIRRDAARDPSRNEIWVRRWALIFTLFLAGIAMAGDLIVLLTTFLNGEELTVNFLLKIFVIFLVAAGIFMHFISDLRGYWNRFPKRRQSVVIGVGALALATVLAGFVIVGTPGQARLARFDAQKVADLQNIQYRVINYWQAKQVLPTTIGDLANSLSYGALPTDPQTKAAYTYRVTGATSFQLCAAFNEASRTSEGALLSPPAAEPEVSGAYGIKENNWMHQAGFFCFDRVIDPSFYPPLKAAM